MPPEPHSQLATFIWSICNLLRGPYKRNEYRKVILPLTVLRRFDCLLAPTKAQVLEQHAALGARPETVVRSLLERVTGRPFYNLSRLDFARLLDDPNQLAPNLTSYIAAFSPNVRAIMEKFGFDQQIVRMAEKNLLYEVVKAFSRIDLSPDRVDSVQMGYVFEELIRIGAEQSNEEAGEHFTPREVIKLMVNLLLSPERDLSRSHVVKTIYDPACGTGGMLSVAEQYIRDLNAAASPHLFGQDWNDEAWAVCRSDMLIKGEDADNIRLGDTFAADAFDRGPDGQKITFDYMLANPPFGVEWKQQQRFIEREHAQLDYHGRFGAGLPRINDGSLLFLQHMLAKMRPVREGGSRIAIVFNGSPLFTGDARSGESNIRRWVIENDWLEAIVALPDQLFYNTGIATYVWVLTNRKEPERRGKIQLIDARQFFVKMRKSLGNKRNKIGDAAEGEPDHIGDITRIFGAFRNGETRNFTVNGRQKTLAVSKVFENADFGFHKITVERPLRLGFRVTPERMARLEREPAFAGLATSTKKSEVARREDIETGERRQAAITAMLGTLASIRGDVHYTSREAFLCALRDEAQQHDLRLNAGEMKAILSALGERDENAQVCVDRSGRPEPDPELRDTENVPLKEDVDAYVAREVLPHVPDAWIDNAKTKVGYEIPLNRHFYVYEPPRPLDEIRADIKSVELEIIALLTEVTATKGEAVHTVIRGLSSDAARAVGLHPHLTFKHAHLDWLGEVPTEWDIKPIKAVARVGNGSTPNRENPKYWDEGSFPWLNSSVANLEEVTEASEFVTEVALAECHLPRIRPPAVLIGITGQGKTRGLATTLLFEATINQHLAFVKPKSDAVDVRYLRRVFDCAYRFLRDESDGGGSTKGAITCEQIANLRIPVPPLHEQRAIADYLDLQTAKSLTLVAKIEAAVERLREYRSVLTTAAVTGKTDVGSVA